MLIAVIVLNIAVYALMAIETHQLAWGARTLLAWGGNLGELSLHGQSWRLFTAMYLHASFQHILGNMALLAIAGIVVERTIGSVSAILCYTLTGLSGELLSAWVHPGVVSIGASGAIAGIMGVLLMLYWGGRSPQVSGRWLAQVIGINALYSLAPDVDWTAHLGGFLAGLAAGLVMLALPSARTS